MRGQDVLKHYNHNKAKYKKQHSANFVHNINCVKTLYFESQNDDKNSIPQSLPHGKTHYLSSPFSFKKTYDLNSKKQMVATQNQFKQAHKKHGKLDTVKRSMRMSN